MDSRDQIKAVCSIAELLNNVDKQIFGRLVDLFERGVEALEEINQSVKLIQEAINNPADDIPVGMTVKPNQKSNLPNP